MGDWRALLGSLRPQLFSPEGRAVGLIVPPLHETDHFSSLAERVLSITRCFSFTSINGPLP